MLASSDWLKSLVSIGAMHSAESFNNRALIRSSPIALLVFKVFKGLRTKDSVILQKENDILLPFHRKKVGGKNFLELLAISWSSSLAIELCRFYCLQTHFRHFRPSSENSCTSMSDKSVSTFTSLKLKLLLLSLMSEPNITLIQWQQY